MYRLLPGRSSCLSAVLKDDGEVIADPASMADSHKAHWSKVFQGNWVNNVGLPMTLTTDHCPILVPMTFIAFASTSAASSRP